IAREVPVDVTVRRPPCSETGKMPSEYRPPARRSPMDLRNHVGGEHREDPRLGESIQDLLRMPCSEFRDLIGREPAALERDEEGPGLLDVADGIIPLGQNGAPPSAADAPFDPRDLE